MTRQEGYGCSFAKLGTLAGVMMKGLKVSHLHGQHGDNIEENLSPRSVLEHRALSGLAIAIDLEEKKNKPSNTGQHVVLGRYCCKQNTNHVSAGQEEHNCLMVGSCHSRDGLTHMTHNVQHTASDAPIVGLQMVASLYPMVHSIGPEASLYPMLHSSSPEWKRLNYSEVGASVPRERMYEEVTRCDERGTHAYLLASKDAKREQEALCPRRINVNMSSNPPLQNVEKLHHSTCKSKENGEAGHGEERFPAGRSMEESIFHYVHPSSSDASHIVTVDNLFPSLGEDFLKICYFCKCHLGVGKDVYIYRGDQAFCSAECRYQQILIDECMGLTA